MPPGNRSELSYKSLPSYTQHSATAVSKLPVVLIERLSLLASTLGPRGHCTGVDHSHARVVYRRSLPTGPAALDSLPMPAGSKVAVTLGWCWFMLSIAWTIVQVHPRAYRLQLKSFVDFQCVQCLSPMLNCVINVFPNSHLRTECKGTSTDLESHKK